VVGDWHRRKACLERVLSRQSVRVLTLGRHSNQRNVKALVSHGRVLAGAVCMVGLNLGQIRARRHGRSRRKGERAELVHDSPQSVAAVSHIVTVLRSVVMRSGAGLRGKVAGVSHMAIVAVVRGQGPRCGTIHCHF
jgi:hypothetical protein